MIIKSRVVNIVNANFGKPGSSLFGAKIRTVHRILTPAILQTDQKRTHQVLSDAEAARICRLCAKKLAKQESPLILAK
jgi:hypothetical protein